jgi:RNA polymerase sigma-70 factor (ECF subfamily)
VDQQLRTQGADGDARGERLRWIRILRREAGYVQQVLRKLGASQADAEDLCQEVLLAMWLRRSTYDPQRPLRPWIMGIAYRTRLHHLRRGGRELPYALVDRADDAPLPDERLDAEGARSLVLAGLARLPERQRTVVVLHDLEEVPMRDIADLLAAPLFTVYTRLRTGRLAFAREIRRALRLTDPDRLPSLVAGRRASLAVRDGRATESRG